MDSASTTRTTFEQNGSFNNLHELTTTKGKAKTTRKFAATKRILHKAPKTYVSRKLTHKLVKNPAKVRKKRTQCVMCTSRRWVLQCANSDEENKHQVQCSFDTTRLWVHPITFSSTPTFSTFPFETSWTRFKP